MKMPKLLLALSFSTLITTTGYTSVLTSNNFHTTPNSETSIGASTFNKSSALEESKYAHMVLSKEEMLEDYDAIWEAFKANSPFLGLIQRKHSSTYLDSTIAKYRKEISDMDLTGDAAMLEFIKCVAESMSVACDVDGHAGIQNSNRFFSDQEAYREYIDQIPDLQPYLDILEDPKVNEFYKYYDYLITLMLKEQSSTSEENTQENQPEQTQNSEANLSLNILEEDKTAYIKINSFDTQYMEGDLPKIHDFLQQVQDYDHLIIDIRENGGGNTDYWEQGLVRPNISEPITTSYVRMSRDSELVNNFFSFAYKDSTLSISDIQNNADFVNLQKEDLKQLSHVRQDSVITNPETAEKLFKGKIWVLTSPQIYSSAESFVVFCKASHFATLVGETTGGGNTGGPAWFELPNSHMLVTFDVEYALNPDGSCSQEIGTIPDVKGEDALQTTLDLIKKEQ